MVYTAPNLSAIVGSAVAAKLLGSAGGLSEFVKMHDDTVRYLGTKSTNLAGFSRASSQRDVGYLGETEMYQSTHPYFKKYVLKKLASRAVFAGRIDWLKKDLTGETGRTYREEIFNKIVKRQEPPPAKQPKSLPVSYSNTKKNRGGRRYRKRKERYSTTIKCKLVNHMQFGIQEESSLGGGLGFGYGMLGQDGNGKLRFSANQNKLSAKFTKKLFKEHSVNSASGLTSSLAFTSVQELKLPNTQLQPHAYQLQNRIQSTYFSELGTFSKITPV
ncbi:hypothetical protein GIB67_027880 [Kingdonia uniflora]|uniref:Nop domain-containing protein n=1 Tax=Kingdonia uniflora TaxID=39325 RepID=A0A7J7LGJ0_9MAGN|nr:hypothetical protein GIB67_027880 [Kingdonia uniflora]